MDGETQKKTRTNVLFIYELTYLNPREYLFDDLACHAISTGHGNNHSKLW